MEGPVKRASIGFIISFVASIFVLANAVLWFLMAYGIITESLFETLAPSEIVSLGFSVLGCITTAFAVVMLIGSLLTFVFRHELVGGILTIVFSMLSMSMGGGFAIGVILGVIGGAFGIAKK